MRTLSIVAATAIFFASCSSDKKADEMAAQAKIDSMSQALMRQHIIDSINNANLTVEEPAPAAKSSSGSSYHRSSAGNRSGYYNTPAPAAAPVAAPAPGMTAAEYEAQRKAENRKKAKSAAIGAAIGAGAGAIGGAVSNKDPHFKKENAAIGAGVGAAVGAGAGLLLQNRKLKKERDTTQ